MNCENTVATKNKLAAWGMKARTNGKLRVNTVSSLLAIVFALALAIPAQAQIDPGTHDVFQRDRFGNWIKSAEIYVGPRELFYWKRLRTPADPVRKRRLYEEAHNRARRFAGGATAGGEGIARSVDVKRIEGKLGSVS